MHKIILLFFSFIIISIPLQSENHHFINDFFIGIEVDYHDWESDLNKYQINGEDVSSEDIDYYNSNYDFKYNFYSYNLFLGYEIINGLKISAMAGLANIKHETDDLRIDNTNPDNIFLTDDPGFKTSLNIKYAYQVTEKISLSIEPQISYISFRNMKHIDNTNEEANKDYSLHLNMIDWNAGVFINYNMDWITPFAGLVYQDFLKNVQFDGTIVDDFDNESYIERDMKFNQLSIIAGSAGCKIKIDNHKYFIIKANFSSGYSVFSSIMFRL